MTRYNLQSCPLIHAPTVIGCILDRHRHEPGSGLAQKLIAEGWPGTTPESIARIIAGRYTIDGDTVVVEAPETVEEAVKELNEHETATDVAEFFKALGIKGTREGSESCPIGYYLRQIAGDGSRVEVSPGSVVVNKIDLSLRQRNEYYFSIHVMRFLHRFDLGEYPDLIAAESATSDH